MTDDSAAQRKGRTEMAKSRWISMDYPPDGAGGQVWVAYPNPHHPRSWNLRVQWTPIMAEHAVEPLWWCPVEWPGYPEAQDATRSTE